MYSFNNPDRLEVLHSTIRKSESSYFVVQGWFYHTKPSLMNLVVVYPQRITLYAYNGSHIKLLHEQTFFTIFQSIGRIPSQDNQHDLLVITTDSGFIQVLRFNPYNQHFNDSTILSPHSCWCLEDQLMIGKTGIRRTVPGLNLAVDPTGRSLIISSIEKQLFIIPLSITDLNDQDNTFEQMNASFTVDNCNDAFYTNVKSPLKKICIGSPIDIQNNSLCKCIVALECPEGVNPLFACLEVTKSDKVAVSTEHKVVFYEFDIGLKSAAKIHEIIVNSSANKLIPVPISDIHPGGILVCSDGELEYISPQENKEIIQCSIPIRWSNHKYDPNTITPVDPVLISCFDLFKAKQEFFLLIQSEFGDLFRIVFIKERDHWKINCNYFDTIPPSMSITISKKGHLIAFSESNAHFVFSITGEGIKDVFVKVADKVSKSPNIKNKNVKQKIYKENIFPEGLQNLKIVEAMPHVAPMITCQPALDTSLPYDFVSMHSNLENNSVLSTLQYGIPCNISTEFIQLPSTYATLLSFKYTVSDTNSTGIILTGREGKLSTFYR